MEPLQAVVLGVIQGLTEFLPISSSGHLVLTQRLFGLTEAELFFDISVHLGTLGAVVLVFCKEIRMLVASLVRLTCLLPRQADFAKHLRSDPGSRLILLIGVGSIPTAVLGVLFRQVAERLFSSVLMVGWMLLVTGTLLWLTRRAAPRESGGLDRFSTRQALIIGVVQGLAIIPGISRSGSTISAGLFLGLNRDLAARFSFLLSIPAIVGAGLLGAKSLPAQADPGYGVAVIGAVCSGLVGYVALKSLIHVVNLGRLYLFAPYCWLLGIAAIAAG